MAIDNERRLPGGSLYVLSGCTYPEANGKVVLAKKIIGGLLETVLF